MDDGHKKFLFYLVVILLSGPLIDSMFDERKKNEQKFGYSKFIKEVKAKNIEEVTFQGENIIRGSLKARNNGEDSVHFTVFGNTGDFTLKFLEKNGIIPDYAREEVSFISLLIINWGPWIFIVSFFYIFLMQFQSITEKAVGRNNLDEMDDRKEK